MVLPGEAIAVMGPFRRCQSIPRLMAFGRVAPWDGMTSFVLRDSPVLLQ